jgi:hypothetical protein
MSDFELLSLGFSFESDNYNALIRVKKKLGRTEYHITIMNGPLEQLLYGDHVIYEVNGELSNDVAGGDKRKMALKKAIVKSLSDYLQRASTDLDQYVS